MRKTLNTLFIVLGIIIFTSCVTYSFTGASIPPEAKTISIDYFENHADFVNPTLSEALTTAIKDRFTSQTSLVLVRQNGDLQLSGTITKYVSSPQAISGNETAALNRLSVSIKVKFVNQIEPDKNYETTFTRYEEYNSDYDLTEVQDALTESINEMLVDDIFNKAVVNW